MGDVEWVLLYVFCYSGYQFTKGSGWEIRCFLLKKHVFMLFLAFSGSRRTGEFCLLAFDINCRLHQVLFFLCQSALPCCF